MADKTFFIVPVVVLIAIFTFREGLRGLRSGAIDKVVKGAETPVLVYRAEDPLAFWSRVGLHFAMTIGSLTLGIWLVFFK